MSFGVILVVTLLIADIHHEPQAQKLCEECGEYQAVISRYDIRDHKSFYGSAGSYRIASIKGSAELKHSGKGAMKGELHIDITTKIVKNAIFSLIVHGGELVSTLYRRPRCADLLLECIAMVAVHIFNYENDLQLPILIHNRGVAMQAIEFVAKAQKGAIKIPKEYKEQLQEEFRVIILQETPGPTSAPVRKKRSLTAVRIKTKGLKFDRSEANER